jgi:hypothetical protein
MRPRSDHTPTRTLITCVWFWVWAIAGALAVSSLDLGVLVAGPAVLLTALLVIVKAARESTSGLVTGFGLPLLFVAYDDFPFADD